MWACLEVDRWGNQRRPARPARFWINWRRRATPTSPSCWPTSGTRAGEVEMITAIVLIHVQRQSLPETAQALLEIEGVAEVYSVAGDYDLVAILRLRQFDEMAQIVTERM